VSNAWWCVCFDPLRGFTRRICRAHGSGEAESFRKGSPFRLTFIAWLLSMVAEVLRNPGVEDFFKSFREGSKVTIVWRGENRFGCFLEVAVYTERSGSVPQRM
jgi:hypothetical protein